MKGADCWGLVRLLYSRERGINNLPDLSRQYNNTRDKINIPSLVDHERQQWKRVQNPKEGDVIVLKIGGIPIHVGMMIDSEKFIHVSMGINACVEKVDSIVWGNRVDGYYRYE